MFPYLNGPNEKFHLHFKTLTNYLVNADAVAVQETTRST